MNDQAVFRSFLADESGAVTVDWTVIGAAVVGLGLAGIGAVRTGVVDLGGDINFSLSGASVAQLGTLGGSGFVYTALYASESLLEQWTSIIDGWNYSETQMNDLYDTYAQYANRYLDSGHTIAGAYIDIMYAMSQVMESRGQALDADAISVESLHNRYQAR